MNAGRLVASQHVRLAVALAYATALCIAAVWLPTSPATVPALLVALGMPLVFRLVPRNYLYGMRVPRTLWTTEDTWYIQNVITGVVMVAVGVIWLGVLAVRAVF